MMHISCMDTYQTGAHIVDVSEQLCSISMNELWHVSVAVPSSRVVNSDLMN